MPTRMKELKGQVMEAALAVLALLVFAGIVRQPERPPDSGSA